MRNDKKKRVKSAKGRKSGSTRWLQRQLNDPYVNRAQKEGYRSRAVYKLMEIDDKFKLLKPGMSVIDLGAAPGGWLQLAHERMKGKGHIIGVDLLEIDAMDGVDFFQGDFTDLDVQRQLLDCAGGKVNLVMSDMAANSTGHQNTDHLKIIGLLEEAVAFAQETLDEGGAFVAKILRGGTEHTLLAQLKQQFDTIKHIKPKASRQDSTEMYIVAMGFKQ